MSDQREINAKNLRHAREKLEQVDLLIKTKISELKDLRKERKDLEVKIGIYNKNLNHLGDYSFDSPDAQFNSDSFPWSKELQDRLLNIFNIKSFRGLQKTVINCTLCKKDCIYIAATGSGKSLVFQLSSLISRGITIVVSPLLSLMEDQVNQLDDLGIPSIILNKSTSKSDYMRAMSSMIDDDSDLKLIYMTPEKLALSKSIMAQIEKMYNRGRFARLVIDEVHCCSQWGHDFRKDYKLLSVFKRQFPETPIIGLTATATSEVVLDIQKILNIEGCYVFKGSFYRPNLRYEIRSTSTKDNVADLVDIITTRFRNQTGIVYCLSIKDTEKVAKDLSALGVPCLPYHAKLDADKRTATQKKWYNDKIRVIAATVAFGLGINKVDVRFVIHYSLSKSLENYYQETGRAGRDGKPAQCICYYKFADVFRATSLTFTEKNGQKHVYQMLAFILNRCECRKQQIADYFEDYLKKDADDTNCCDNCSDDVIISNLDARECLEDLIKIIKYGLTKKERMTSNKLLDSWTQTRGLKLDSLRKPALTRSECETVLGLLIVDGYLKEDFHITPYNTISYIVPGPRADTGVQRQLPYRMVLEHTDHLKTIEPRKFSNNMQSARDPHDDVVVEVCEPKKLKTSTDYVECFTID